MRAGLPSGTVTFLFTDVEGSTKLLHELGAEAYADALAEHRRVVREACSAQGGAEVDMQGDAFFFAFPTAPGALTAASAFTESFTAGPIRVRVGVHTGTPLLTEEGYVGHDVHRAARIAACGHGGQVLVSASTAVLTGTDDLRDLGEHRLKDLSSPERIYQLGAVEFPPLKSLYRTNLPVPATPFLGRERELAEVVELLSADDARLLTLTGPGGSGKTRLALAAAGLASDAYPDGVFWVPLAPLRDPTLVLDTAAQAVSTKDGLAEHIADKKMLCLFDNFEQVVEAGQELADLLASCANLDILVTSRERLRVRGEQTYPVPPLAESDGEALFVARARAVDPSFVRSAPVALLCARLDELPLALELAAARTALFSPEQLLERLSQRLDLLRGERDADPRQQTLRATIEWSYDLLGAREQELFARLAIFAGGCSYAAAEEVAGADPDTLQSLLDKSLLRRRDSGLGPPRYWMLETIREYATERLEASEGSDGLIDCLHRFLIELAESEGSPMFLDRQAEAFERLQPEHDNLRVVVAWAVERGHPEKVAELVADFSLVWNSLGHVKEAERWVHTALEARGAVTDDLWIRVLLGADQVLRFSGDHELARALMEEDLELLAERDDPWTEAIVLTELADACLDLGDVTRARAYAERSLTVRIDRELPTARAKLSLGDIALRQGDLSRAETLFQEAAHDRSSLGHDLNRAYTFELLAEVAHSRGDHDRAAGLLLEAMNIGAELGDEGFVGECLKDLALVEEDRGNASRAAHLWILGTSLWERAGSPFAARRRELGDLPELAGVTPVEMSLDEAVAYAIDSDDV